MNETPRIVTDHDRESGREPAVRGYRRLRLLRGGRLASVATGRRAGWRGVWPTGEHTAVCAAGAGHRAPAPGCGCGLYALHEPPPACRSFVLAAVCGWGAVEVHAAGWRAEHARIVALAPAGRPLRRERIAARRYGVPLVAPERLAAVAGEHGAPVPQRHHPARPQQRGLRPTEPLELVRAAAQRIYDAFARPIRATPGLPVLVLAVAANAPLVAALLLAWQLSRWAQAPPASASGFEIATLVGVPALACLLALGVPLARSIFGSGIALTGPTVPIPVVLAIGAAAPLLAHVGAPRALLSAVSCVVALLAITLVAGATLAGAIGDRCATTIAAIAALAGTLVALAWVSSVEILIASGLAAYVSLRPETARQWWRRTRCRSAGCA